MKHWYVWPGPLCIAMGTLLGLVAEPGATRPLPQAGAAAGQQSQQPQPAQRPASTPIPTMRTTTRLVQVSVVAHDGHGQPISDLTADDFRVFDNGQEMKVEFFSKESSGDLAAAPEVAGETGPGKVWSNRGTRGGLPVNITILLWDALNTRPADQSRSRQHIIRFLSTMRPEDRIALYALGDELRVLHDFTSDSSSLLRAVERHGTHTGTNAPANTPPVTEEETTYDPDLDAFLAGQDALFASFQTQDRVLRTVDALEAIATHVASLPGRKSLVWISDSFPLQLGFLSNTVGNWEFSENVERAARALNDANVAVYPVDPRGVATNLGAVSSPGPRPGMRMSPNMYTPTSAGSQTTTTMEAFATLTGGVAYHDTNDLSGAIRQAMDDSRLVYTLAYTPLHGEWDGKYRKIKVEVRRSGVHLRYRSGYLATPYTPMNSTQQTHVLAEAQWSPLEAAEIGLSLQAEPATVAGGKPGIRFSVVADPAGLRFTDTGGMHAADLVLTLAQKAADGRLVFEETKTLTLRLPEARYQAVVAKGLRLAGSQPVDSAAVQFRVVILDLATGRLGSLQVPVSKLGLALPPAAAAPAPPKP